MDLRGFFAGFVLILAAAAAGRYGYLWLERWGEAPAALAEAAVVEVPRGTSLKQLSRKLYHQQIVSDPRLFQIWVRLFSDYSRFQAGLYRFEDTVRPIDIAQKISDGEIYVPVVLEYTIPEGFTLKQITARLAARGVGTEVELRALSRDPKLLQSWGVEAESLEGYFFPATYTFAKMPSPEEALELGVQTFWKNLPEGYREDAAALGLSLQEAVTFASLIELETAHEDEKPFVSEVIWNRLKENMALAIDAAIIYGIDDYQGNLRRSHLTDRANRYNTRVHAGLPPTPICSPSRSSLEAVLNPTNEGYYYYVLELTEERRHHFSKTLREHNAYVRKLVAAQRDLRRRERAARRAAGD